MVQRYKVAAHTPVIRPFYHKQASLLVTKAVHTVHKGSTSKQYKHKAGQAVDTEPHNRTVLSQPQHSTTAFQTLRALQALQGTTGSTDPGPHHTHRALPARRCGARAAHSGRPRPHQLREVAGGWGVAGGGIVVLLVLLVPAYRKSEMI